MRKTIKRLLGSWASSRPDDSLADGIGTAAAAPAGSTASRTSRGGRRAIDPPDAKEALHAPLAAGATGEARAGEQAPAGSRRRGKGEAGEQSLEQLRAKLRAKQHRAMRKLKTALGERIRTLRKGSARLDRLCEMRRGDIVPVKEPMLLVTQAPRSGGTLLSQLFDGHPQCHAHPFELAIGRPDKSHWPSLDLSRDSAALYRDLREKVAIRAFLTGYRKRGKCRENKPDIFPFLLLPELQEAIFEDQLPEPGRTQREALDAYLTSYFNAWLDYQSLRAGPKRWVTAFVPRLLTRADSLARFFADYPQGRIVTIVRDPRTWFVSARLHNQRVYGELDRAIEVWRESALASLAARDRHGARVIVLSYEDIVTRSRETLWSLADAVGIERSEALLTPTFNGRPIRANSSFAVGTSYGILAEAARRHEDILTPAESTRIERQTRELHEAALAVRLLPTALEGPDASRSPSRLD